MRIISSIDQAHSGYCLYIRTLLREVIGCRVPWRIIWQYEKK
jgi:hypothetical protein